MWGLYVRFVDILFISYRGSLAAEPKGKEWNEIVKEWLRTSFQLPSWRDFRIYSDDLDCWVVSIGPAPAPHPDFRSSLRVQERPCTGLPEPHSPGIGKRGASERGRGLRVPPPWGDQHRPGAPSTAHGEGS